MNKKSPHQLVELVKYPVVTDKTTTLFENNQYTFAVSKKATKNDIKSAIEYMFEVKVKAVNTINILRKKRRVGQFIGYKASFKKAIVGLGQGYTIELFPDTSIDTI